MSQFIDREASESEGSDLEPTRARPIDSSEEDTSSEMNEEDIGFINDDVEDEDATERVDDLESQRIKKKKKKRHVSSSEEEDEMDEEDFHLIAENSGQLEEKRSFKRLKQHVSEPRARRKDVEALFNEDDEEEDADAALDEDDLDSFIEYDDEDQVNQEEQRAIRQQRQRLRAKALESSLGIKSEAWQELQNLFGTGDDYLDVGKEEAIGSEDEAEEAGAVSTSLTLEQAFEPTVLAEHFVTEQDDFIRVTDVPERLLLASLTPAPLPQEALTQQVHFLMQRLGTPPETAPALQTLLRFLRENGFEVPFIAKHRLDYIHPWLTHEQCWQVYDLDAEWRQMESIQRRLEPFLERLDEKQRKAVLSWCEQAQRLEQMSLIPAYFLWKSRSLLREEDELLSQALKWSLTAEQFAENLLHGALHLVQDLDQSPVDYFNALSLPYSMDVLVDTLAQSMLHYPPLLFHWWQQIPQNCSISTSPTAKGLLELDQTHPYFCIKYLSRKPMTAFEESSFTLLLKAEQEDFIRIQVDVQCDTWREEMKSAYLSDRSDQLAQEWNEIRMRVVDRVIKGWEKRVQQWVKEQLQRDAVQSLCRTVRFTLQEKVLQVPWLTPQGQRPRVMAVTWTGSVLNNTSMGVCFVVLDYQGQFVTSGESFVTLRKISNSNNSNNDYSSHDTNESPPSPLASIVKEYAVHAVCFAGWSFEIKKIFDSFNDEMKSQSSVFITFVEDQLARCYQHSALSEKEFPRENITRRYLISLARRFQDPLSEACHVLHDFIYRPSLQQQQQHSILPQFHPFQSVAPVKDLVQAMERALIHIVNHIGVDVNHSFAQSHKQALFSFIAGMGPRKAMALMESMKQFGAPFTKRLQFLTVCHFGKCVFLNAASSLVLYVPQQSALIEQLTVIHPEDYSLVYKMANDALDEEGGAEEESSLDPLCYHIQESITALNQLDLEAFAEQLLQQKRIRKQLQLTQLRRVLVSHLEGLRKQGTTNSSSRSKSANSSSPIPLSMLALFDQPWKAPSQETLFTMLLNEWDATFFNGLQVIVQIIKPIKNGKWLCRLLSLPGLIGILDDNFNGTLTRFNEVMNSNIPPLAPGVTLKCVISQVDKERFSVDLNFNTQLFVDDYFDEERFRQDREKQLQQLQQNSGQGGKGRYLMRQIIHPHFANVDRVAAESMLKEKAIGEALFRPSSKGVDHLTVTWKVSDELYQHLDIREEDKLQPWTLGKVLWLEEERYEDLDEIMARHIDPMASLIQELMNHAKYMNPDLIESSLRKQKKEAPKRIPYAFHLNISVPGKVFLVYLPNQSLLKESVTVTRVGWRLRGKFFETLDELIGWFKAHWQELGKMGNNQPAKAWQNNPQTPIPTNQNYGVPPSRPNYAPYAPPIGHYNAAAPPAHYAPPPSQQQPHPQHASNFPPPAQEQQWQGQWTLNEPAQPSGW